jgi:hypothetical protein
LYGQMQNLGPCLADRMAVLEALQVDAWGRYCADVLRHESADLCPLLSFATKSSN